MCAAPARNRVLLVDDDALTLRVYCEGLLRQGFQVDVAADGLAALRALRAAKPDVAVIDLLMPKLSGFEVLKFIRETPALADLRVVVLSNSYVNDSERPPLAVGAQRELLKGNCSPRALGRVLQEVLAAESLAQASEPPAPRPIPSPPAPPTPAPAGAPPEKTASFHRQDFLSKAPAHCAALRSLFEEYKRAPNQTQRQIRLTNLFRKVHFLTALAGLAELPSVAQMSAAFEALLFLPMEKPEPVSSSLLHTIASAIDTFPLLLTAATGPHPLPPASAVALVVDDDPLIGRLVVSALRQADLRARATDTPLQAWEWLQQQPFDLVFLDIEMPERDGFELCRRLRALPGYAKTPVIFITSHADLQHRAQALASGGDDFVTKPILAPELALKAVMAVLRTRLAASSTAAPG